jgi:hypothetical protein
MENEANEGQRAPHFPPSPSSPLWEQRLSFARVLKGENEKNNLTREQDTPA